MADEQQQATGQQATGDATGQQGGNAGAGNGGSGDDKKFTQAELDAIVKDRLERERKAADTKAQRDREATEAKALEDQKEFQKLAEQRQARITELEPVVAKAERYEAALKTHLDAERANLPAHLTALLDKLDPADQLEWIATNREAITAGDDQKAATTRKSVPATGRASNGTPTQDIDQRVAQARASGAYPRF